MVYRVKDVAQQLLLTEKTVRSYIRRGELQAIDIAKGRGTAPRYRIPAESVTRFLAERGTREDVGNGA